MIRGSAGIYGAEPHAPQFFGEEMTRMFPLRTRFQRDVAEIENYFETYSRRHPEVTCTMLRYQPAIGPSLDTQITRYLSQPACPTYLGFDPRIQLVHEDDALDALVAAIRRPGARRRQRRGARDDRAGAHDPRRRAARAAARGPAVRPAHRRRAPARARLLLGRLPAPAALRPRRGHRPARAARSATGRATRRSRRVEDWVAAA